MRQETLVTLTLAAQNKYVDNKLDIEDILDGKIECKDSKSDAELF